MCHMHEHAVSRLIHYAESSMGGLYTMWAMSYISLLSLF
jgi:hypothetical protein